MTWHADCMNTSHVPATHFQKTIWESAPRQCLKKIMIIITDGKKHAEADWMKISPPTNLKWSNQSIKYFHCQHNTWMNKQTNQSTSLCLNVDKPTFKTRPSNLIPSHREFSIFRISAFSRDNDWQWIWWDLVWRNTNVQRCHFLDNW